MQFAVVMGQVTQEPLEGYGNEVTRDPGANSIGMAGIKVLYFIGYIYWIL